MSEIRLKELIDEDVALVEIWLSKNHVRRWFEPINDWIAEIRARHNEFKFIKHYIAFYEDTPIGFCQYYACSDAEEDWYGDIPLLGTYSIDYLLGEEKYLDKGLGKRIVYTLANEVFSLKNCQRIIVKPEEENHPSCNVLLSNGFVLDMKNQYYCKIKK